ncbi:MAG TPA: AIR synthase related protein [Gaiellales bacterium]|jgi:thiamine-monophosphate kinase
MLSEDDLVAAIAAVAGEARRGVEVGIGDDACVLAGGLVASTDMLVDGVHFDAARMSAADIGHRAAAASLSDMAAMGAEPVCLLASFGVPAGYSAVADLAAGMAEHGVVLAGGDLCRSPGLVVSVTALGRAERPVLRSGGRPGDLLVVTGTLGGQAASGYATRVTPRLAEGRALAAVATAMLDLSDGIATDVRRLAAASGTGAVVELERLPRASGATIEQAAAGGEDYELLAAVPADVPVPIAVTVVGRLTDTGAVALVDADGVPRPLRGWDHFA